MKEYKTLTFKENDRGKKEMEETLNELGRLGWILKSSEYIQNSTDYTRNNTAILNSLTVPLWSKAKRGDEIVVVMEREITEEAKRLDQEQLDKEKEEIERVERERPDMSKSIMTIEAV